MKLKILSIPFIISLVALVLSAIFIFPSINNTLRIKEALEMENIEYTFLNMDEYFPTKTINKSSNPFVFPKVKNIELPQEFMYHETNYNTLKYIDSSYTQGLLVIQDDTLVYENYWRGQKQDKQHISWSMAKSYISALFGIALAENKITSIHQRVEEYLPELRGSGYEGVKIKDILEMSSGVKFDETYSDPNSDIIRWMKTFAQGKSQDKFAGTLINERPPGTYNHYVSINTHVLGMILVKATGRSLTDYLHEKIWEPIGAEYDAYWLADGKGMEMALGGLNACLRDYAKFGQLYLRKGRWNGKQIIPVQWVVSSTHSTEEHLQPESKNSANPGVGFGYQWWLTDGEEGEFMAVGIFNQYIYINPHTKTIIVKNSANQNYYDTNNPYRNALVQLELFRAIAHIK